MSVKSLLKDSILQAKKLKQISTLNTKDKLISSISQNLKKKLNQNEQYDQEQDLELEDVLDSDQNQIETNDVEDEILLDEQDDQQIFNIEDDETVEDEEYQDMLEQLESQDQTPYTEDALEDEVEIQDEDQDEQQLMQKIKSILQSEQEEQIVNYQQIVADDQEQQMIQRLKRQNKRLRKQNAQYNKAIKSIKSQLNQAKYIQLKGKYALNIFEKYNLSKNQKMRVIQNFDRAKNQREIKLIYATLVQSLKKDTSNSLKPLASSKMKSTKTKIKENRDHVDSSNVDTTIKAIFRKRAGI